MKEVRGRYGLLILSSEDGRWFYHEVLHMLYFVARRKSTAQEEMWCPSQERAVRVALSCHGLKLHV